MSKYAVIAFQYEEKPDETGRNGWLLLSALNLLSSEGDSYAEVTFPIRKYDQITELV